MTPSQKAASQSKSQSPASKPAAPSADDHNPADDEFTQLSYEQARDALSEVVRRLEGGAETLEESLALWERGEALARRCERWLAGAQARLDAGQASPSTD